MEQTWFSLIFQMEHFWGKTRETATMFNKGFKDSEWYKLLEETGYIDELKQLCSVGYAVIV